MKKIISFFLSFLLMFTFSFEFSGNKVCAEKNYNFHVAIFCDDINKANDYVKSLCQYKFDAEDRKYTQNPIESKEVAIITHKYKSTEFHIHFHILDVHKVMQEKNKQLLGELMKHCIAGILIYNVEDDSLKEIIQSKDLYAGTVEKLKEIDTLLNNWTKRLQQVKWTNALSFITYNQNPVPNNIRERLSSYTDSLCEIFEQESWGRGAPKFRHR